MRFVSVMEARDPAGGWELLDQGNCEGAGSVGELAGRPTGWCLERNHRQVMFAEGPELSVFSETTSAPVSSPHAHPAWTLLLPVDGGTVTVTTGDVARVHTDGVLLAPQYQYRAATDGPHVAVYLNAWMSARPDNLRPRVIDAATTRRLLDALAVDDGIDLSAGVGEVAPIVGEIGPIDSRLAIVIAALPEADRLEILAAEVGMSPSRLRALARSAVGVPLTHVRLWSRLTRAIAWLPYVPTAVAAAAAGFADQAHLSRTARRFLGRSPRELSLRSLELRPPGDRQWGRGRPKRP